MDIRAVIAGFPNVAPLAGLDNAWHWSRAPADIAFAGTLSADGSLLLQVGGWSFEQELAVATLKFAREHEEEIFTRNPFLSAVDGFTAPAGYGFDSVARVAPEVHRFYEVENPALNPLVHKFFPAYACEFSGKEDLDEALTRYNMLPTDLRDRAPAPFLKMRFINTRTKIHTTNPGGAFFEPEQLEWELREMNGGENSLVEFEDRHGKVWRVEWHDGWWMADWTNQDGAPREIGLDDLLTFAQERLRN